MKQLSSPSYYKRVNNMNGGKIFVWGWWQGNNLGDNWILDSMKMIFENAIPIDTSVTDFSFVGDRDIVICGGGGLFVHDIIPPWDGDINIRYGIFGVGTEFGANDRKVKRLLDGSAFFYVRDRMTLEKFNIQDESHLMSDVTFYNPLMEDNESSDKIVFIWRSNDFDRVLYSKKVWRDYIGEYVALNMWRSKIAELSQRDRLGFTESSLDTNSSDINSIVNGASMIISQRYHGLIAAIQKNIPCIGIDICPKIRSLMKDCGLNEYCIKIGEIEKVNELYEKAKEEKDNIVNKMQLYTREMNLRLLKCSDIAKEKIKREL